MDESVISRLPLLSPTDQSDSNKQNKPIDVEQVLINKIEDVTGQMQFWGQTKNKQMADHHADGIMMLISTLVEYRRNNINNASLRGTKHSAQRVPRGITCAFIFVSLVAAVGNIVVAMFSAPDRRLIELQKKSLELEIIQKRGISLKRRL